MINRSLLLWGVLLFWSSQPAFANGRMIVIDDFEAGINSHWEEKIFKGKTGYTVVSDQGNRVLRAESHAAASGLIYRKDYDPKEFPILAWRWKVSNILTKGDEKTKSGDDYAARVYVVFPHWFPPKTRTINYIWANRLPKGHFIPNSYFSNAVMLAVESGTGKLGPWVEERRDVSRDYRMIFGEDPPTAGAIAIMTDTDNTGESAVAYYDDIRLLGDGYSLPED